MSIIIDSEFRSLIPPLTSEEYHQLEQNCVNEGIRDPLVVWKRPDGARVLIDGHNRYRISTYTGLPFQIVEKEFNSRKDVILWIIDNQFGRRNLEPIDKIALAEKREKTLAEQAKEREKSGVENPTKKILQGEGKTDSQIRRENSTAYKVAKEIGMSEGTYRKGKAILEEAPPEVIDKIRNGELSISRAYEETRKPHVAFNSGNNEWYTPANIIEAARAAMGSIDLDPASNEIANKVVKAGTYYTIDDNGLEKTWFGNVWLNPPYASDLIVKFIDKLIEEGANFDQAVVLVNNATETEWFCKLVSIADSVCFPKGRVKFYMPDGKTGAPLQGQAIVYIGERPDRFHAEFARIGWGCRVVLH